MNSMRIQGLIKRLCSTVRVIAWMARFPTAKERINDVTYDTNTAPVGVNGMSLAATLAGQ